MADPEGFEPSIPSPVYSLSRGALSTTQPQVPWFVERAGYEHLNRPSSMASVLKSSLFLDRFAKVRSCENGVDFLLGQGAKQSLERAL
jgi:hypothetical protein